MAAAFALAMVMSTAAALVVALAMVMSTAATLIVAFAMVAATFATTFATATAAATFAVPFASAASTVAVTVASAVPAVAATVAATVTATVAAAPCSRQLPVKTVSEFLSGCLADTEYLSAEIESLVGHRMVQVHLHEQLAHFRHLGRDDLSCGIGERHSLSDFEQVVSYLPVNLERRDRQFDYPARVAYSVPILGGKGECESGSRLESLDVLFEFRKKHASSENEIQRSLLHGMVNQLSVDGKFINQFDYFVALYFHCCCNYLFCHHNCSCAIAIRLSRRFSLSL